MRLFEEGVDERRRAAIDMRDDRHAAQVIAAGHVDAIGQGKHVSHWHQDKEKRETRLELATTYLEGRRSTS
jgi:hypothetical protein